MNEETVETEENGVNAEKWARERCIEIRGNHQSLNFSTRLPKSL